MAAVHAVPAVHQHAVQAVQGGTRGRLAHERGQVQVQVEVDLWGGRW